MELVARVSWLPVGAGGHVARRTSAWWERAVARREHRPPAALVHARLEVVTPDGRTTAVEMTPTWGRGARDRSVVATGPVGLRGMERCPLFRYEVRSVCGAVGSTGSVEVVVSERLLRDVASVPRYTWGRDEAGAGEMWTSNSLIAWLLVRDGVGSVRPPRGSRAPGWDAGCVVAARRPRAGSSTRPDVMNDTTIP